MEIKTTPLFEAHQQLGARIAPFGGWSMPIQYSGILAEHEWTRSHCALFDICHMGEFMIQGDLANSNLEYIVTINIAAMAAHTCRYGFMLDKDGGVLDDIIVYKISSDNCMIVVNAATTEADEVHLRTHLSPTVRFENISAKTGKLDLQGPDSREVLMKMIGPEISRLAYYTFDYFKVCGQRSIISRTGYTGELGYELYCDADKVKELWTQLLQDKRVKPAGLGARDTLRLEVGYPLYGQDMDKNCSPLEAGFESFIDFNKNFLGKEALLKQKKKGLEKRLVSFVTANRRAPRHNYKIFAADKPIGTVTSGSFAPSLGYGIGMGYVDPAFAQVGQALLLRENSVELAATVAKKPFYNKGTARI